MEDPFRHSEAWPRDQARQTLPQAEEDEIDEGEITDIVGLLGFLND